jgi:uncharacterized membrane protein YeiH
LVLSSRQLAIHYIITDRSFDTKCTVLFQAVAAVHTACFGNILGAAFLPTKIPCLRLNTLCITISGTRCPCIMATEIPAETIMVVLVIFQIIVRSVAFQTGQPLVREILDLSIEQSPTVVIICFLFNPCSVKKKCGAIIL